MEKSKKRIAFVIRDLNNGGLSKMLKYYSDVAYEVFKEVHIILIGNEYNTRLIDHGRIKLNIVGSNGSRRFKHLAVAKDIMSLRKIINTVHPDILFPFASGNVVYTYLAVGKRYYTVGAERGNPEELKPILRLLSRHIYKKIDYAFFQSKGAADFYSVSTKLHSIIPNPCIIPDNYSNKRHVRESEDQITIVSMSRLGVEKNIDEIITAACSCANRNKIQLKIYGDGVMKSFLEGTKDALDADGIVSFEGNTDEPLKELLNADIFILASSGEGMPNSLIEAMSLGVACISTNCMANNTNSLIKDGINGLIVNKHDVKSISDAIDRLVEDRELYESVVTNAIKIRDELSDTRIHGLIADAYREIAGAGI